MGVKQLLEFSRIRNVLPTNFYPAVFWALDQTNHVGTLKTFSVLQTDRSVIENIKGINFERRHFSLQKLCQKEKPPHFFLLCYSLQHRGIRISFCHMWSYLFVLQMSIGKRSSQRSREGRKIWRPTRAKEYIGLPRSRDPFGLSFNHYCHFGLYYCLQ